MSPFFSKKEIVDLEFLKIIGVTQQSSWADQLFGVSYIGLTGELFDKTLWLGPAQFSEEFIQALHDLKSYRIE